MFNFGFIIPITEDFPYLSFSSSLRPYDIVQAYKGRLRRAYKLRICVLQCKILAPLVLVKEVIMKLNCKLEHMAL